MWPMKRFQNQVTECLFLFAHEKIGIGESYLCSQGGAEDLVDFFLRMKSRIA